RPDLAAVHLAAFTSQVAGLRAGGHLSAAEASALTEEAEAVAAAVTAPCSTEAAPIAPALTAEALALPGAYPNPSTGRTTITYDVPKAAAVRLAVYDALGREVAVLVDGEVEAGRHEASLDAATLAPGVYLVRLSAGAFTATRRVTVVR